MFLIFIFFSTIAGIQDLLVKQRIDRRLLEKIGPSLQKKHDLTDEISNLTRFNVCWTNSIAIYNRYNSKFNVKMFDHKTQVEIVPTIIHR